MPEVVRQVRKELGPDAVILHTRPVPRQGLLRFLGGAGVEVVAAADERKGRAPARSTAPSAPEQISEVRAAVADLRGLLVKVSGARALHPGLAPLYERLVVSGVDEALAVRALSTVPVFGPDGRAVSAATLDQAVRQALIALFAPAPPAVATRRAVQAFVGPTGAGKTTMIAKLAVRGHLAGTTTRMLSMDAAGLAAGAPLEALSRVLGLPYELVATEEELAARHVGAPGSGLTLVDTPGLTPRDHRGLDGLARLLASLRPSEIHLVLSATTKPDDARAAVAAFTPLGVTHLAFTRLDETRSVGSLVGVAVDSRLPLSFFGTGRDVPTDLRPASAEELLRRALEGEPAS